MFKQIKLLKLRIKCALSILFDKDFNHKAVAYKQMEKYLDLMTILSKGKMFVEEIGKFDFPNRDYYINLKFITNAPETCFNLRRLFYMYPVINMGTIEETEEMLAGKK